MVLVTDTASGLRAVIAIHSTALGPSLGGIRFWRYPSERDARADALALSEAMTLKAAAAGLHLGGGKAVVMVDDPAQPRSEALLEALGRAIDDLGGRYLAAEDVGATTRDMDLIARVTPWVTGVSEHLGGSGDPSPVTAWGLRCAMQAVVRALDGEGATLAGRRVAIQGAGKVGSHLARLVADEGAVLLVADVDAGRAHAVAEACGAEVVPVADVVRVTCDVLAPCALGGVLSEEIVPELRCRAVCGAANNQLASSRVDDLLAARGVLYAPDFVVSAGGIINIAEELRGYERARALRAAERIGDTVTEVIRRSRATGFAPGRVAEAMARERIAREGAARRWRPGDPAAWTGGLPMRALRPIVGGASCR